MGPGCLLGAPHPLDHLTLGEMGLLLTSLDQQQLTVWEAEEIDRLQVSVGKQVEGGSWWLECWLRMSWGQQQLTVWEAEEIDRLQVCKHSWWRWAARVKQAEGNRGLIV